MNTITKIKFLYGFDLFKRISILNSSVIRNNGKKFIWIKLKVNIYVEVSNIKDQFIFESEPLQKSNTKQINLTIFYVVLVSVQFVVVCRTLVYSVGKHLKCSIKTMDNCFTYISGSAACRSCYLIMRRNVLFYI